MPSSLAPRALAALAIAAPSAVAALATTGRADAWLTGGAIAAGAALGLVSWRLSSGRAPSPSVSEDDIVHSDQVESLGMLAGGIAHDFNNLLTGILGNTAFALADLAEGPAREAIVDADRAARRARDLVAQILAYSGRGSLELKPIDLPAMVLDTRNLLGRVISPRATLDIHGRPEQVVEGDPAQVRQVVMNLLTNASDALGDREGTISVRIVPERLTRRELDETPLGKDLPPGRYIRLEVRDTGCGMSPETMNRMFEPYFTTKATGSGLGLAALLGIVRRHRGTLRVQSEVGRGTQISVWFPAPAVPLAVVASDPGLHRLEATRSGRVLLAEDEEMVRKVTARMLSRLGYDVISVADGREAFAELEHGRDYALALIDVQMPGADGREVLRRLRERLPDVPAVLMTGYAGAGAQEDSQPDAWLRKPFSLRELMAALDTAQVAAQ